MTPTEILCQLIATPSVNPMGRNLAGDIYFESRMSDWLVSYFERLGAPYERIDVAPGRANIIARFDPKRSRRTILLDAHQDTVPIDGMTIDPFDPVIRDGKIYGRGSCDVKGGMAAMLHAFGRLFTEQPQTETSVVMCCTCDEESDTIGVSDLVTYWQSTGGHSKLLAWQPDGAVVAEPTELHAVVAHKGVVRFRVHSNGLAVHSSEPALGKNAIYAMADVVTRLRAIAQSLTEVIDSHPLCGSASLSVGRIEGGTSVNIVPAHCEIEIDRRIIPGEDPQAVYHSLVSELKSVGKDIVCDEPWVSSPALGDQDNARLARAVLMHVNKITAGKQSVGVPYCTHASTISAAGVPSIVFGPGSITQAHTKDEFIEMESLDAAAEVYFGICTDDSCWEG